MFTLSFLFLINLSTILTCVSIETSKRCECTAMYGMGMQSLASEKRSKIIQDYARSLLSNMDKITEANKLDFDLAQKSSTI